MRGGFARKNAAAQRETFLVRQMSYLSLILTGLRTYVRVDVSITISTDGRTFPTELTFMPSHVLLQQASTAGACHAIRATGLRRNYATIRSHTVSLWITQIHGVYAVCTKLLACVTRQIHTSDTVAAQRANHCSCPQLPLLTICRAFSCTYMRDSWICTLENDGLESDRLENDGVEQEETYILHTIKWMQTNVYDT